MHSLNKTRIIIEKSIKCLKKDRGSFGLSYRLQRYINRNIYDRLSKYAGIHDGKRCFIIGTGPSLSIDDVNMLKGEYCFGVNTLYKIYKETDWRANYYCVIDPNTYKSIGEELRQYHTDSLFIAGNRIKEKNNRINKFSLECSSFYRIENPDFFEKPCDFSTDISVEVFDGASVVYATIQIAAYMGFKDIYLLGVDCNYDKNIILHNKSLEYEKGYKYNWTQQTGLTMIEGFKVAKNFCENNDLNIYNATRGGMLEVFERVDLDELIGE